MDATVFNAKLDKWKRREPRQFRPSTNYGRPSLKRIPRDKFAKHVAAVNAGRFAARNPARKQQG